MVFKNVFKSSLLLLMTLPDLNDTVLHSCLAMTVRDTKLFQQYITDLMSDTLCFVLFGQEKPLRWKEKNTRTHARTHTHITLKFWTKGDCLFFIKFTFKFSKWPSHLNAGCFNMFLLVKYGYIYSLKQVNYCAELFYKFRAVCKGKTAFDCFVSC